MFLETLWNFIQVTNSPILNLTLALYISTVFMRFLFRIVNVPFIRAEFRNTKPTPIYEPLYRWILLYWLLTFVLAAIDVVNFYRLILTSLISVAMVVVYILRKVVTMTGAKGDKFNAFLFWLIEMENTAGEVLSNERNAHQQQMNTLNRTVAASRNISAVYRQSSLSIVELIKFAQRTGGFYNLNWVAEQANVAFNDAIRKAAASEKQMQTMKNQAANPAQPNADWFGNYGGANKQGQGKNGKKGGNQPQQQSSNKKGGNQSQQQYQQPPFQQPAYQPPMANNWNGGGMPNPPYNGGGNQNGMPVFNQGQPYNQGQQYFNPDGTPMSKNQIKKMQKANGQQNGQQGGFSGAVDPRMQPHQYQPENEYVPPVQHNWNQGNGYNQQQTNPFEPLVDLPINMGNQWEQTDPFQPFVQQPTGWNADEEETAYPIDQNWIPQQPVWNSEPQPRNNRGKNGFLNMGQ